MDLDSVYSAIPEIKRVLSELDSQEHGSTSKEPALDVLINNAGVLFPHVPETVQGLEPNFGVNYVSNFVLTCSLLPCLRAASSDARVISVSSVTYKMVLPILGGIKQELFTHKGVLELGRKEPKPLVKYAHSKYAILQFMLALDRREASSGSCVRAFAVDPGVVGTSITRNTPAIIHKIWLSLHLARTPEIGAQTAVHCALAEEKELQGGNMYSNNRIVQCSSQVHSEEAQDLLWKQTEELLASLNLPRLNC